MLNRICQRNVKRWMPVMALVTLIHTAHADPAGANDWQVIDDFRGYADGYVSQNRADVTEGVWLINILNNDYGTRIKTVDGNKVFAWGRKQYASGSNYSAPRFFRRGIGSFVPESTETVTYFTRFFADGQDIITTSPIDFGLADGAGTAFSDYMVRLTLRAGSLTGKIALSAWDGNQSGGGTESNLAQLDQNKWYNFWIVAEQNKWSLYVNTGNQNLTTGDRLVDGYDYVAAGTSSSIGSIMHNSDFVFANGVSSAALVDAYLFSTGNNLVIPRRVIDDFEYYPTGLVRDTATADVWTLTAANGFGYTIKGVGGNQVLGWGRRDGHYLYPDPTWAHRAIQSDNRPAGTETVTYFTRFFAQKQWSSLAQVADNALHFGLADAAGTGLSDYMVQLTLGKGSSTNTIALSATDGDGAGGGTPSSALAQLEVGKWHNFWIVVEQDNWSLYVNSGDMGVAQGATIGDRIIDGYGYRAASTSASIGRIMHADQPVWADNLSGAGLNDDYLFLPNWEPNPPAGTIILIM